MASSPKVDDKTDEISTIQYNHYVPDSEGMLCREQNIITREHACDAHVVVFIFHYALILQKTESEEFILIHNYDSVNILTLIEHTIFYTHTLLLY